MNFTCSIGMAASLLVAAFVFGVFEEEEPAYLRVDKYHMLCVVMELRDDVKYTTPFFCFMEDVSLLYVD